VTVDLDTNIEAGRPFMDAASPTHPSLTDPSLSLVDMFGITNVPYGVWVDESGTIVRPAEISSPPRDTPRDGGDPEAAARQARMLEQLPEAQRRVVRGMMKGGNRDPHRYANALRDWVAKGADSEFALSPDEVVERSRPRPEGAARAAAEFELGQHLHRAGHKLDAVPHFQAAHELDPENWSYSRQAFALVDDSMGKPYDTDLLTEIDRIGLDTFYPAADRL